MGKYRPFIVLGMAVLVALITGVLTYNWLQIFESRLAPTSIKTGGVAAVIRSKKRPVAVKVDKVIGVSGFIHPGNRVDVLVTIATGKTSDPITKIVLQNILVLAVGPEISKTGEESNLFLSDAR